MSFTYKGLSAQLEKHTVTEDEINRQLHRLLQQSARIAVITDRPTQSGDEVVLDYAGFVDGEQFPAALLTIRPWFWVAVCLSPALESSY